MVSGNSSCQGRIEIFHEGQWGTVCDDEWDLPNAAVACRQLGCGPAVAAIPLAYFGYGSGPVLLDNVDCRGDEDQLTDCFHLGWGQHNCGHHEDAGVICMRKALPCEHTTAPSQRKEAISDLSKTYSGLKHIYLALLWLNQQGAPH